MDCSILSTVEETGVISIFTGFTSSVLIKLEISVGIVAEKNRVCFLAGILAIIRFTS
ncbi:hypothetical protein D3C87_2203440 [compost metagenome]